MRLGVALAAGGGNKDEHAEAAVASNERFMKSLRSIRSWNSKPYVGARARIRPSPKIRSPSPSLQPFQKSVPPERTLSVRQN
jgi:hypothetical protein